MSDKNDSAKFDTKRQGKVLCLDGNGIRDRGQRHRTVPCPAVKLRIAAHIDEIAEVSKTTKNNKRTSDGKNHSFAKDRFTYRRAYFEDFDGQYYEITISVGHNGTIATVYDVGKVNKSVLPSAKKIAVVGSKPLGKTLSKDSIRNPNEIVKENDSAKSNAVKLSARKGETAEKAISYFGRTYSWKKRQGTVLCLDRNGIRDRGQRHRTVPCPVCGGNV